MYPLSITLSENKPNEKVNKKHLFTLGLILALGGLFICHWIINQPNLLVATKTNVPGSLPNNSAMILSKPAEAELKTYSNKKYGFKFQYPPMWTKEGKDVEAINLAGAITNVIINFSDSASKTTLLIEYNLAPKGSDIYKYALAQYDSSQGPYATGSSQLIIDGRKALQATSEIRIDGRGNPVNPPLRLILVDLLDKAGTGEFQFQLKTPLASSEVEVTKLKKLLSSFAFTN